MRRRTLKNKRKTKQTNEKKTKESKVKTIKCIDSTECEINIRDASVANLVSKKTPKKIKNKKRKGKKKTDGKLRSLCDEQILQFY